MNPKSIDVMCKLIINIYINWQDNPKDIRLAKFVDDYNHNRNWISIKNNQKIIKFVSYNQFKDLENWSREQLLLYVLFIGLEI